MALDGGEVLRADSPYSMNGDHRMVRSCNQFNFRNKDTTDESFDYSDDDDGEEDVNAASLPLLTTRIGMPRELLSGTVSIIQTASPLFFLIKQLPNLISCALLPDESADH